MTASRPSYLPGVDGLRALAVLAVLVYHARADWLPGGFLGVEVFFVISGFLITRGLLGEWHEEGRINVRAFWLRRARRLLPALFLLLAGVIVYAGIYEPEMVAGLRLDVLAALGYVTNWQLILDGQSYFESFEKPSMLRHLWSLAVEEQFYILWPLALTLGLKLLRPRQFAALVLLGALGSALAMAFMYKPGEDTSRIYYGTDTRAAALLCGAALAFVIRQLGPVSRLPAALLQGTTVAAVALLAAASLLLDEGQALLYRGGFLGVSLAACVLIFGLTRPSRLTGLLGCRPLVWVGVRSYAVYLWHWPVLLFTWPEAPDLWTIVLQVAVILALAEVSYRFVEMPVRRGALSRLREDLAGWGSLSMPQRSAIGATGGLFAAGLASLAVAAVIARPSPPPAYARTESIRINTAKGQPEPAQGGGMNAPAESGLIDRVRLGLTALTRATGCGMVPAIYNGGQSCEAGLLPARSTGPPEQQGPAPAGDVAPTPAPTATPSPTRVPFNASVTAIGDSVMLGASSYLAATVPALDLDASIARQTSDVIVLLQSRRAAGALANTVVVQAGNNGTITSKQFEEIMGIAGPGRKVVFVNVSVPRPWQDSNNAVLAEGVKRYDNAVLVDWKAATEDRSDVFASDNTHLTPTGGQLFARLVVQAIASTE